MFYLCNSLNHWLKLDLPGNNTRHLSATPDTETDNPECCTCERLQNKNYFFPLKINLVKILKLNIINSRLTAGRFLISAIFTVLHPIAKLRPVDAKWFSGYTLWTEKFVTRTNDGRTTFFVRAVLAVFIAIALVGHGDAEGVLTPKLVESTWWKI